MELKQAAALGLVLSVAAGAKAEEPAHVVPGLRAEALRAHMRFLADDRLEGRGTGTRGYDLAAAYVAAQFEALGLKPAAADGGYFQPVPLRAAQVVAAESRFALVRAGRREELKFGRDFVLFPDFRRERSELRAEVVFVGFGVSAPELGHDDYAGIDVRGKVVAFLFGAPKRFPADPRAHYTQMTGKLKAAARNGAVGALLVRHAQLDALFTWPRMLRQAGQGGMRWRDAAGEPQDAPPELRASATLSLPASRELIAASGKTLEAVVEEVEAERFTPLPLRVEAQIRNVSRQRDLTSANVAGLLPGSDPALAAQTVVFSAHLDHLGVGEPDQGDAIYNGAYDNASGVAALIEVARAVAAREERPRRPVLFLAVTGEERGLLGSDYYAQHPTVPGFAADLNLDTVLMLYPFRDLVAFGAEHSSLGEDVARAAQAVGLELSPDPVPEQVIFVRSDHYSFVRRGVPAIFLMPGFKSADPARDGEKLAREWTEHAYHSPKDDLAQPIEAEAGLRLVEVAYLAGAAVADAAQAPRWNAGDFFGRTFASKAPPAPAAP